jgi:hypothetical protein
MSAIRVDGATSSAAIPLALLGVVCAGCSTPCSSVGCDSGAWLTIGFASPAATLTGQTVTIFRNAECYTAVVPAPDVPRVGEPVPFPGATAVRGWLFSYEDQTSALELEWTLSNHSPQPPAADRYTVTLTDTAGTSTILLDQTATYSKTPLGDHCGPICWSATLTA